MTLAYNKREAKSKYAFNAKELKKKISEEIKDAGIFRTDYDVSKIKEVSGRRSSNVLDTGRKSDDTKIEMDRESQA